VFCFGSIIPPISIPFTTAFQKYFHFFQNLSAKIDLFLALVLYRPNPKEPPMDITLSTKMTAVFQQPSAAEAELQDYALRLFIRWTLSRKHLIVDEPNCKLLETFEVGAPTDSKKKGTHVV